MKLLTVTPIHRCSTICCFDFVYAPILENKMSNGSSGYYQFDTVIEELNKITTQDHNSPFRVRVYTYLISTLTYFLGAHTCWLSILIILFECLSLNCCLIFSFSKYTTDILTQ